MRSFLTPVVASAGWVLLLVALAFPAPAALTAEQDQNTPQDASGVLTSDEAKKLVEIGNRAIRESNNIPSRAVDAALAFLKALPYYKQAADSEMISELEAAIFWAKKRMNIDDVKRFLAAKGDSQNDMDLLASADQVIAKKVTAEDAQTYFDRAERFAGENPTSYARITARYFEVAERFSGTEIGKRAHALSLAAQKKDMELLAAERLAVLVTIFSQPEPMRDEARAVARPMAEELRTAHADLKKTYKTELAQRRPGQRRALALQFATEAKSTTQAPALRAALLEEAIGLASDLNDFPALLTYAEQDALAFSGPGVRERQRQAMAGKRGHPVGAAILKLLDDGEDQAANTVVGRYFCLEMNAWDPGIPILARSETSDLQVLCSMELIKPEGWMQQVELADRWYTAGKKTYGEAKQMMMARSFHWYGQAQPNVSGLAKDRITQRLDEVGELLPIDQFKFDKLTAKQWDRLPGKAIELSANEPRTDIGLVLKAGMRVRVVPHPTERWTMLYTDYHWSKPRKISNIFTVDCLGYCKEDDSRRSFYAKELIGSVRVSIENGERQDPGIISGVGSIFVGPYLPGTGRGKGTMRIKVILLDGK